MSDVWRDLQIDPISNIDPVLARLCDLFGVAPYTRLITYDLTICADLARAVAIERERICA